MRQFTGLALSRKYRDGEVIFVDTIEMKEPKAKEAKGVLMARLL